MSDSMEKWRTALGLTPEELAGLLGVSRVTVWRWLSGSATPRERYIVPLERWERGDLLLVRHRDGSVTFEPPDTMDKWVEAGAAVSPGKGFYGPPPEDPDAEDPVDRALNGIDDIEDPRHLIMVLRHLERRLGAEGLAPEQDRGGTAADALAALQSLDQEVAIQVITEAAQSFSPNLLDTLGPIGPNRVMDMEIAVERTVQDKSRIADGRSVRLKLTGSIVDRLDDLARKYHTSRSEVVRALLSQHLLGDASNDDTG